MGSRIRWPYLIAAVILIAVGLPARMTAWYPPFVVLYAADALWAMMIYLVVVMVFARLEPWKVLAITVAGCWVVEISQLYQAEWIKTVRHWPGVGMLIGYGFLWSDMAAYVIGPLLGFALDHVLIRAFAKRGDSMPEAARG